LKQPILHPRRLIGLMTALSTASYFDRTILSVAAPTLMRDALVELGAPEREKAIDETPRAARPEDALRPVAALMPARDDELEEIDDVIGMKMGQEDGVERAARGAGGDQPLRRARAAIDEEGAIAMADEAGRAEPLGIALRAAGAKQGELHGARPI